MQHARLTMFSRKSGALACAIGPIVVAASSGSPSLQSPWLVCTTSDTQNCWRPDEPVLLYETRRSLNELVIYLVMHVDTLNAATGLQSVSGEELA